MSLLTILLQAAGGSQQWSGILMMVVIVAIFYFFMIRPQQKKQKEIQKAREALKAGDKVITAGGIYGKIKEIGDTYMLIENIRVCICSGRTAKINNGTYVTTWTNQTNIQVCPDRD